MLFLFRVSYVCIFQLLHVAVSLNKTRDCDEHLFGQVSTCTGHYHNCLYSVAHLCTSEATLAHNLGALNFDDLMSYNSLTTQCFLTFFWQRLETTGCCSVIWWSTNCVILKASWLVRKQKTTFFIRLPPEFLPASGPTERWCASTLGAALLISSRVSSDLGLVSRFIHALYVVGTPVPWG